MDICLLFCRFAFPCWAPLGSTSHDYERVLSSKATIRPSHTALEAFWTRRAVSFRPSNRLKTITHETICLVDRAGTRGGARRSSRGRGRGPARTGTVPQEVGARNHPRAAHHVVAPAAAAASQRRRRTHSRFNNRSPSTPRGIRSKSLTSQASQGTISNDHRA